MHLKLYNFFIVSLLNFQFFVPNPIIPNLGSTTAYTIFTIIFLLYMIEYYIFHKMSRTRARTYKFVCRTHKRISSQTYEPNIIKLKFGSINYQAQNWVWVRLIKLIKRISDELWSNWDSNNLWAICFIYSLCGLICCKI